MHLHGANSYVKFKHAECYMPRLHIDGLHNKSQTMQVSGKNRFYKILSANSNTG